jgi:hypothetical protein
LRAASLNNLRLAIRVGSRGKQVTREFPAERYQFDRDTFAADPRPAAMVRERDVDGKARQPGGARAELATRGTRCI